MKAFIKVGKSMSFSSDLPSILPTIVRSEEALQKAQSAVELPMDQIKYSMFWFMKATPFDDIAFNHLQSGDIASAKDIWSKKESVSSLLNLIVCSFIENRSSDIAIYADKLFQNYGNEFCQVVNETVKLNQTQLIDVFIDSISSSGTFDISTLINVSGTSGTWNASVGKRLVQPIIDEITSSISEAKQAKGVTANYNAGVKLMNGTKESLAKLRSLLGTNDMQYQMIADKLAQAILQCGINYFNDSNADDAPEKALRLQNYALSIAVGQMAKDRCKENVDILKNIGPEYKVRNEMDRIANILKRFNSQKPTRSDQIGAYAALLRSSKHTLNEIDTFVGECKPDLQTIKAKLGATNELYIKISSTIASCAINALVDVINTDSKNASMGLSSGGFTIIGGLSTMRLIGTLDMSTECRNYYQTNYNTLNQIYNRVCPKVDNSSGGCYIATMVYGDYDHPQVMVLRDFRDSYLDKREWGKRFIKFYYKHSPNWVEHLKSHHKINRMIQACLDSFIFFWKKSSSHE
jgi:hypothetical protein